MNRRTGQRGTVVRKGSVWHLRYFEDVPGGRIRRSVFIGRADGQGKLTKSEAKHRAMEMIQQSGVNTEAHIDRVLAIEAGQTLRQQAEVWLANAQKRKRKPVKPATLSNWVYLLNKHVNPVLGDLPLADVGNAAMKRLVETLSAAKLAPASIRNICNVVKLCVASAVNDEGEQRFPRRWNAEWIDAPAITNLHQPVFTSEQVGNIVAKAEGKYRVLFALLAGTGMRAGEALGLEIGKHISEDCSVISVKQSLWHTQIQSPKTQSAIREIDLHPELAAMLKEFIGDRKSGFLFVNRADGFLSQTNILRRHSHPILASLGIAKCGLHAFRRFRVTQLRRTRIQADIVRLWIGHADQRVEITDTYSKLRDDKAFRIQACLDAGLGFDCPNCPSEGKIHGLTIAA
jgi:integrase